MGDGNSPTSKPQLPHFIGPVLKRKTRGILDFQSANQYVPVSSKIQISSTDSRISLALREDL